LIIIGLYHKIQYSKCYLHIIISSKLDKLKSQDIKWKHEGKMKIFSMPHKIDDVKVQSNLIDLRKRIENLSAKFADFIF